jgi:hypothetical protein
MGANADLAGDRAGGHRVLVVAEDRVDRLHPLGKSSRLLAEYRLGGVGRASAPPPAAPRSAR